MRAERGNTNRQEDIEKAERVLGQDEETLQFTTERLHEARRAVLKSEKDMNDENEEEVRTGARINGGNGGRARDPEGNDGRGAASSQRSSSQRSSSQSSSQSRPTTEEPPALQRPVRRPGAGDGAP